MSVTTSGSTPMHPNGVLLQRLFTALDQHDHITMASCYHPKATFHDIAFDLQGKDIHDMWRMICDGSDIRVTFEIIHADDHDGRVKLVDDYTYRDTKRPVHNVIDSQFRFQGGFVVKHTDCCDPQVWAAMALGGVTGCLAGRIRLLRSLTTKAKLKKFLREPTKHP